ncbi:hypothetical protein J5N97_024688 [Dioscorea zingiberensis]|uniref:Glycosyltransferase n=1 Tax=Dioscorea zingiberensis TaxID=325984 RepID=A0A9D5H8W1_9LILI|nr:hypothetical protein J5N97_024688 [Dioscorea zingiberensis]
MDSVEASPLHLLFFPFLANSHMIPMLDIARLAVEHGAKASIVTTPGNVHLVDPLLRRFPSTSLHLIPFPTAAFDLPDGCENLTVLPLPLAEKFFNAVFALRDPLNDLLYSLRPDAIISDVINPWTAALAGEHHIPHVLFQSNGLFAHCVVNDLALHRPYDSISDRSQPFSIPGFPHPVQLTRSQLPELFNHPTMLVWLRDAELSSHAVVVNTFYALEPYYAEHYYKHGPLGRHLFLVGPVALFGGDSEEEEEEKKKKEEKKEPCLEWLDKKANGSVVYVGFGTMGRMKEEQVKELAFGLESSGEAFVWVVESRASEWIPEGYEKRVEGRGLVVRGWAPQKEILSHLAVGCFLSHCGWNSVMEAVTAGVPVITWPIHSEQFVNEKMLVEVVKVGIPAWEGFKSVKDEEKVVVPAEAVVAAVKRLMSGGEEVATMRKRVGELAELARMAVAENGTSNLDINRLISGLVASRHEKFTVKG